jgi:hypothetical protein
LSETQIIIILGIFVNDANDSHGGSGGFAAKTLCNAASVGRPKGSTAIFVSDAFSEFSSKTKFRLVTVSSPPHHQNPVQMICPIVLRRRRLAA